MIRFQGFCKPCGTVHGIPTTDEALREAQIRRPALEAALGSEKGRMLGVLIGEDSTGKRGILQAYSGTTILPGLEVGWAPPTRNVEVTQDQEKETFRELNQLSGQIESYGTEAALRIWEHERKQYRLGQGEMQRIRAERKAQRAALRAESPLDDSLEYALKNKSQDESRAYREDLARLRLPMEEARANYEDLVETRLALKRRRRELSISLQAAFMAEHSLMNFRGEEKPIQEAILGGLSLRQGVGECAAPKLLQDAARRGLRPIALCEVWAGPPQEGPERRRGESYPPCEERCIPILGHLLCGSDAPPTIPPSALPVLAEGEAWVTMKKPGNLLSVPGRGSEKVDSVLTRVRTFHPRGASAETAHRLDFETSGVQLIALSSPANSALQTQFVKRETEKTYLAWIEGIPPESMGTIDAPIRQIDRHIRGHEIHPDGKPAQTSYSVLGQRDGWTLLALRPRTGRTHQLRVHCAQSPLLGYPIVGDPLYGSGRETLFLHAWSLRFKDPSTGQSVRVECPIPDTWPEGTLSFLQEIPEGW